MICCSVVRLIWSYLFLRNCKLPLESIPLEPQKHPFCRVLRAFVFVWWFVQSGWRAMILNSNHYSGLFFSTEFTGVPGRRLLMSYVSLQSTHGTRKYACSNCCYMTKFLWPTIYVYQPACGDSKWGYVKFMASKTYCSLDVQTSFAPRSDLVNICSQSKPVKTSQNPARRGFGNGLLLGLTT